MRMKSRESTPLEYWREVYLKTGPRIQGGFAILLMVLGTIIFLYSASVHIEGDDAFWMPIGAVASMSLGGFFWTNGLVSAISNEVVARLEKLEDIQAATDGEPPVDWRSKRRSKRGRS